VSEQRALKTVEILGSLQPCILAIPTTQHPDILDQCQREWAKTETEIEPK